MSSENISVSNTQPSVTSRRASTPLPPKPPPPLPMKQHSVTDGPKVSTFTTNDAALPSVHETASNSSPPLGPPKKPSPAPKPSRLSRALSSGYMTLPSFWKNHKRSKSARENEKIKELGKENGKEKRRKEKNQEVDMVEDKKADESDSTATTSNTANGLELRDAPLWKLPGLEITQRRHSTTSLDKDGSPKPPSQSTTQEVSELLDTPPQLPEHLYQEDLPLKPTTATTRALPDIPSEFSEHQPSPRPTAAAANAHELPELPNTPRQLPKPHLRPAPATTRELPELPNVLPQFPEHHSPDTAAVATTRELPALPNQLPNESFPIPIPVTPLSESPPMQDSPPPELPPRPEAPLPSLGTAASQEAVVTEQKVLPASPTVPTPEFEKDSLSRGNSMSLRDFVQKHSKSFPIRIRVLQGYCSEDSEFNISTDDMYNIHFIKHTKVIMIRDEDGVTYSLPMGSAMKFGFIYNPSNNLDEALNGYNFEKVSDVMAMPMLPKIIRTTKGVQSSDDKWALEEGEILVTRHVHKPVFKGRKGLKVFSLLTQSDKVLPEDCTGHFTTKPSLVQLHLPEIIQHIPNPFPSLAVMYSTSGSTMQLHNPGTQSRVITMCESSSETSLVASPAVQEGQEGENHSQILFDIPLNDDISDMEVEVIQTQDEEESEHLYDDTLNLFEKFDPTMLQPLKTVSSSPPSKTQSLFLHSVRRGYEKVGVNIEAPYVNIQNARCVTAKEEAEKDADDQSNGYATVGFKLSSRWHSYEDEGNESAGYDHVGYDKPDGDPKLTSWVQDLHTATQALESRLSSLESGQPSAEIGRMQSMLEQLTHKLESVDTQLQHMAIPQRPPPPSPQSVIQGSAQSTEESNKSYLSSLDEDQILKLLEAMDLGRYCEEFQREHITGEILTECNEEVLQHELGMASKIHRIRLMKIISGQHTARNFLRT